MMVKPVHQRETQISKNLRPRTATSTTSGTSIRNSCSSAAILKGQEQLLEPSILPCSLPRTRCGSAPNASKRKSFRIRLESDISNAKETLVGKPSPSSSQVQNTQCHQQPSTQVRRPRSAAEMLKVYFPDMEKQRQDEKRNLRGYKKIQKLGKGGFGTVWLVQDENGKEFALKQIPLGAVGVWDDTKKSSMVSAKAEIFIARVLFPQLQLIVKGPFFACALETPHKAKALKPPLAPSSRLQHQNQESNHHHISFFPELYRVIETSKDLWLLYERSGQSLSERLFEIKGEFINSSRVYRVHQKPLYKSVRSNPRLLKQLVRQLIQAVETLSQKGIVHGDIKPDNILIETDMTESTDYPSSITLNCKLVDFGSSFFYDRPTVGSLATPEYVPPEVLDINSRSSSTASDIAAFYHKNCTVHSFDMWAIGVVLLEILAGFPVWFSYRARVQVDTRVYWTCGLFTSRTGLRDPQKIIERLCAVVSNLDSILEESPGLYASWSATNSKDWSNALDLVKKLLNMKASTRISPQDALSHVFLRDIYH